MHNNKKGKGIQSYSRENFSNEGDIKREVLSKECLSRGSIIEGRLRQAFFGDSRHEFPELIIAEDLISNMISLHSNVTVEHERKQ
jgi:hypothetical protein